MRAREAARDVWLAIDRDRHAPDFDGGLTDHLPMATTALCALGASSDRIDAFARAYAGRLEPAREHESAKARSMAERLLREGAAATIASQHLERGLAGAAFHGVIAIDWACRQPDPGVLGRAIAYAARVSTPLPMQDAAPATDDLDALAERLRACAIPVPRTTTIGERLVAIVAHADFQRIARELATDERTVDRVSLFGARAYLAHGGFASLHVLTGAAATRSLRSAFDAPELADHALGVAALACFVASGCPALADESVQTSETWDAIAARAITSDDDHVCKLVCACRDEEAATGRGIYGTIADVVSRRGTS